MNQSHQNNDEAESGPTFISNGIKSEILKLTESGPKDIYIESNSKTRWKVECEQRICKENSAAGEKIFIPRAKILQIGSRSRWFLVKDNKKIWERVKENISTFSSTSLKKDLFAVHFAVHLQSQYKQYISVQISTSGHPAWPHNGVKNFFCTLLKIESDRSHIAY